VLLGATHQSCGSEALQFLFSHMTEGWVAEIVGMRGRFSCVCIQRDGRKRAIAIYSHARLGRKHLRQPLSELGDLQRVGQTVVKDMALKGGNDLSDASQAPIGRGVDDAVAIPLVRATVVSLEPRLMATVGAIHR
jgi:hypothetical protein